VIGGHQPVAPWKDLELFQRFTAELAAETTAAHRSGRSVEEAAAASSAWMSRYPGYNTARLPAAVKAIYEELSGK
jgi:hypothetical protein